MLKPLLAPSKTAFRGVEFYCPCQAKAVRKDGLFAWQGQQSSLTPRRKCRGHLHKEMHPHNRRQAQSWRIYRMVQVWENGACNSTCREFKSPLEQPWQRCYNDTYLLQGGLENETNGIFADGGCAVADLDRLRCELAGGGIGFHYHDHHPHGWGRIDLYHHGDGGGRRHYHHRG